MIGAINSITKKEIIGWATHDFDADPIQVNLFVNGKKIAQKVANEHRIYLLENRLHKNGNCGFTFDISKTNIKPLKDDIQVKVLAQLAQTKVLSQKLYMRKRKNILKDRRVFFFIHIPKTAGTSFRNMLYTQFDQENIYPNKEDIAINLNRYPKIPTVKKNIVKCFNNIQLFGGHYTYAAGMDILGNNFIPIVIFRDPIKRTISLLYQLKRMNPAYQDKSLEYIFDKEPNQVTNVQTYYMTGGSVPLKQGKNQLDLAMKRLKTMEVFGIVEMFDEFVDLVEKKYGWKLGNEESLNRNPTKKPKLNSSLLAKIKEANSLDIELYKTARNLFEKMI